MTLKEIFDRVKAHLLAQGVAAVNAGGGCCYRDGVGGSCAVGCLISDEAYSPDLENRVASSERVMAALARSGVPTDYDTLKLLGNLQDIHDYRPPNVWAEDLDFLEKSLGGL